MFFECKDEMPLPPFFVECGTWFTVVDAFATFTATPAIEGFVASYQSQANPQDLTADPPPKNGTEYVPRLHLSVDDLASIGGSASIDVCAIPLPLPVPCIASGVPVPHIGISVSGDCNFDFWDPAGGPADILSDPDGPNNNPWHLSPIFHDPNNHLFPFD